MAIGSLLGTGLSRNGAGNPLIIVVIGNPRRRALDLLILVGLGVLGAKGLGFQIQGFHWSNAVASRKGSFILRYASVASLKKYIIPK